MIRAALVAMLVACGGAPSHSRGPAPAVKQDVERAEDAELHRRHDVARTAYERAIADAQDPRSQAFARREFAETLVTWGELDEARVQLEAAVTAMPDDAAAWHDLGLVRHKRGDDPGAQAALERAKQLAPKDPRPRIALAALLMCRNDLAGATAEYRAMLELELPDRVREKVRFMLDALAKQAAPLHCS